MRELGVIEPSMSEWCSLVVIVLKKDGFLRVCIDFHAQCPVPVQRLPDAAGRLSVGKDMKDQI